MAKIPNFILTFVRKYFPPTNRCDVSHLERRTARGVVAPRPTSCVGCVDVAPYASRESATWKCTVGWKLYGPVGTRRYPFVAYHFGSITGRAWKNLPVRFRTHQFSLGVRPYAPWYWHLDPAKTRPTIDRFHDAPVISHRMLTFDTMTIGHWFGLQIEFRGIFVSLDIQCE